MTHTDYTKEILNIKDNNIYFYKNCLETKKENGLEVKVFHGYLTSSITYLFFIFLKISFVQNFISLLLSTNIMLSYLNDNCK